MPSEPPPVFAALGFFPAGFEELCGRRSLGGRNCAIASMRTLRGINSTGRFKWIEFDGEESAHFGCCQISTIYFVLFFNFFSLKRLNFKN